jgi:hypothetical protein
VSKKHFWTNEAPLAMITRAVGALQQHDKSKAL